MMKKPNKKSLRKKLMYVSIIPLAIVICAAVFTLYTAARAISRINELFKYSVFLNDVVTEVETSRIELKGYLATRNSENLRNYIHGARTISEKAAVFDKGLSGGKDNLVERNVSVLLKRFLTQGDLAVKAKRGRNIPEYGNRYGEVETTVSFLKERLNILMLSKTRSSLEAFSFFSENLTKVQTLNVLLILFIFIFSASVIIYYSLKFTDPVIQLSWEAERLAKGDFSSNFSPVESEDEIGMMTKAFNIMKASIKDYIDEIRNKAELESSLMDARVKNLEMEGSLKHAELKALQARINPHFLFNTLNASIQLAVIEDADKTRLFLENLATLMRYSFRDLDSPVTLSEELGCLEAYFFLLSIRFPGRYEFSLSIDEKTRNTLMPKMIIQPLAENSVRHGLTDLEENARISIIARNEGLYSIITISDNGVGIRKERIDEIYKAADSGEDLRGDEGGLGLCNVIRRLSIFSGNPDPLVIESPSSGGTNITIMLPLERKPL